MDALRRLQGELFEERRIDRKDQDWLRCWVQDRRFEAASGPENSEEVLAAFLSWAQEREPR